MLTDEPPELGTGRDLPDGFRWRSYHCLLTDDRLIYEVEIVGPKRYLRAGRSWMEAKDKAAEAASSKGLMM